MTKPGRFLVRMALFLVAVGIAVALLFPSLRDAFLANVVLNGLILAVLLLGIIYNFRQVIRLWPEVAWIETFRSERTRVVQASGQQPPRLLAPMAAMLGERQGRLSLTAPALRSMLDGIASRLDESRDLSRYTIGLLVFLGLLGTFWGLMLTVGSVGDVIRGLSVEGGDAANVFADLKAGLEAPIGGMGTAFSSSLFGLGGSLILGFLDLQAGQAQNRFYTDLEDWLSGVTRLSSGLIATDGDHSVPAYVQALLEQTAESLDNLQEIVARGEEGRAASNAVFKTLSEQIGMLTDRMHGEQSMMTRLVDQQAEMKPVLARLSETIAQASSAPDRGIDDATRSHIRNIELYMSRLVDEQIVGREEILRQVRSDFKLLARTIAAVRDDVER
jgi:hypothetical protein